MHACTSNRWWSCMHTWMNFLNAWRFDDACASAVYDAFLTGTDNLRYKIRRVVAVARKLAS